MEGKSLVLFFMDGTLFNTMLVISQPCQLHLYNWCMFVWSKRLGSPTNSFWMKCGIASLFEILVCSFAVASCLSFFKSFLLVIGKFRDWLTFRVLISQFLFMRNNINWFRWAGKRDKVFKNRPSKICGRQPLKNLKGYGVPKVTFSLSSLFL